MITISGITRQYSLANSFTKKYGSSSSSGSSSTTSAAELATKMAPLGGKLEEARASKTSSSATSSSSSSSSTTSSSYSSSTATTDAVSEHNDAMSEAIAQIKENLSARLSSSDYSPTYSRPTVKASTASTASSASSSTSTDSLLDAIQKKGSRDLMNARVLSTVHASGVGTITGSYTVTVDPSSSKVSVEASGEGSSSEQAKAIEEALNDAGMSSSLYSHISLSAQGQGNTQLEDASGDESPSLSITLSSDGLHDIGQENGFGNGDTAWIQKLQAGI